MAFSRGVKLAVVFAGSLLAIVLTLMVALQTEPARRYALAQLVLALQDQGLRLELSRLEYSLFQLTASAHKIVVRSAAEPNLPPILVADSVQLQLGLTTTSIPGVVLTNPKVHVYLAPGRDNIPRIPPSKSRTKADFVLEKLTATGGEIFVEDRVRGAEARVALHHLTVTGSRFPLQHAIDLTAAPGGQFTYQARTLPVEALATRLTLLDDAAQIRSLELRAGGSSVQFEGRVSDFENPAIDGTAATSLVLARLSEFGGLTQPVEGTLQATARLKGPVTQIKADGELKAAGVKVDQFQAQTATAKVSYDGETSRVAVSGLAVSTPYGIAQGTADIGLTATAGRSQATITAPGVDVAALTRLLKAPVTIASRATVRATASWPALDYEKASGTMQAQLTTTGAPAKDVLPVSGALTADAENGNVRLHIANVTAAGASASGDLALRKDQNLGGNVKVAATDLATTTAVLETFLGREPGSLASFPVSGSAAATASLSGTLKSPAAKVDLSAPDLAFDGVKNVALEASANYTATRVTVDKATARWQGQTATASGAYGIQTKGIELKADSSGFPLPLILTAANLKDVPVTGELGFHAAISGTVDHPQGEVRLNGANIVAYSEPVGTLTAMAQLDGKTVRVNPIELGPLKAQATYEFESKQHTLQASADWQLTQLQIPGSVAVRGPVQLTLNSKGSINDPEAVIRLSSSNLEVDAKSYGPLQLNANVVNQRAAIEAAARQFHLTAKADVATQAPYQATFEVKAQDTDLASLPVSIDPRLKGTISANVSGETPLNEPAKAQIKAQVPALNITFNEHPVRSDGAIEASYASQRLTIEKATVLAAASRLSLSGTLPLEESAGAGAINVDAKLNLTDLAPYIPTEKPLVARGPATLTGTISGNLKRIDPNIALTLEQGYLGLTNPPIYNATIRAEVSNGVLKLSNFSGDFGPASFTATGTIPLGLLPEKLPVEITRGQGPAQLTADLKEVDLGTIEGLPRGMGGLVTAHLEATAPKADAAAITGTLSFPKLELKADKVTLVQDGVSTVGIANGVAKVEQFALKGPSTNLAVSGTAKFIEERALNLQVQGAGNASILGLFTDTVRADGNMKLQAAVGGTVEKPEAKGSFELADANVSLREPRVDAENLQLRVDLDGRRLSVARLEGALNGGTLTGSGSVDLTNTEAPVTSLKVSAEDVFFDFPKGLKTSSNIHIQTRTSGANTIIGGEIIVLEGGFTDDLFFDRGILAAVLTPRSIDLTEERNPALSRVQFDVAVRTDTPLVIKNNLAKAEITADLRLLGNPYEYGLNGRLTLEEGGELVLQERKYALERGNIDFTNSRRVEPNLDVLASTTVDGFDIKLQVSGEPGKTETTLTSDPGLPEPDILALLLTGRQMDEVRGKEFEVARNQMLSYLTGRVGSTIGREVSGATGLSTVRIEPNLIAGETDPSARLTVGQNITRNLQLVYSMDLVNSADQIYLADYAVTRRFTTRGTRQSDGSYRFDFRHDLRFGGQPEPRRGTREERRRIGKVNFLGETFFPSPMLASKLKVKEGDRYDFAKLRKGVDRVNRFFADRNLLESNVRLKRNANENLVDLALTVKSGPAVDFVYQGASVPGSVQKKVRNVWHESAFERQREEEATATLRTWLVGENFLQPEITLETKEPNEKEKHVVFTIKQGPKFHDVQLVFEGAKAFPQEKLRDILHSQKLSTEVHTAPGRVTELLARYYQEQGYLDATVRDPRLELDAAQATGRVVYPVTEGPLYKIGTVTFDGNTLFTREELDEEVPLPKGDSYQPVLRENSFERLRNLYWDKGYNDVETQMMLRRSPQAGQVDLVFKIVENKKSVVAGISVEGNSKTSEKLIRSQLELKEGDVLDMRKLGNSRRNLYLMGAYASVDITREEVEQQADQSADHRVQLRVKVRELQPFQLKYGAFYDTERGPGGIADISNRNTLGSARVLGLRTRYDSQLREGRVYFTQPKLLRFPLQTTLSPYIIQERNPVTEDSDAFYVDRLGFSVNQQATFGKIYVLNYGYKIERTHTYDPPSEVPPDFPYDIFLRIATLNSTFTRDSRDDILDAARGSFASQAFQFSPEALGSQVRFVKYFGQYFRYFPLQKPRIELFTNRVLRPRLVFATGVRVGLARGLGGQEIPPSERFYAGGSNSIRGFAQNTVGPQGAGGAGLGGQGLLVLNNEIRTPLYKIIDGVAFVDMGNVYGHVSDFSISDIRKAGGLGLRVRTPWFLLRADYGVKFDRRAGESFGRFFFSIGQAF
ncbi:MAG: outer membrane protein assembly factor BamA [Acidobacteria bacterium]|nr:outer membrane protein assembly factor BamA [Acidobacteriota bacterium]